MPVLEVTGAYNGRYQVREARDDGTLVIAPEVTETAMLNRLGPTQPLTPEEFQTRFGHLPTDDDQR